MPLASSHRPHRLLLVLLLSLLFLHPLLPVLTSSVFLAAVIAAAWILGRESARAKIATTVLTVPAAFAAVWLLFPQLPVGVVPSSVTHVLLLALLIHAGGLILLDLLHTDHITADTIFGTVNLYLIIGFMWAFIHGLVEQAFPGSFDLALTAEERESLLGSQLVYYSFVTMTTLGYGDITPLTIVAQRLVIIETIMGQFYVAVVVAYLVAKFHSLRERGNPSDEG